MTCKDHESRGGDLRHLTALTYSWELSGERFYLDEALRIFGRLVERWSGDGGGTVIGTSVEELANVVRLIGELGEAAWKGGEPVLEPRSAEIIAAMRADPRFRANATE